MPKKNVKLSSVRLTSRFRWFLYLNESCMFLSGMSSGPHGQTSAPAHKRFATNLAVCTKVYTVALSASAACHQLLLPSDATDVPEVLELLEQDGEELCRALQCLYLTSCVESFEILNQCTFAAEAMALGDVAECVASHTACAEDTVRFHHERVLSWLPFRR